MSDNQNNPKQECKCLGDKKAKALEKQISELFEKIEQLQKEVEILRKVLSTR